MLDDWGQADENGMLLKKAHQVAENFFSNVITPDSDANHADHLHLDNGLGYSTKLDITF